jgi:hypothetical protein
VRIKTCSSNVYRLMLINRAAHDCRVDPLAADMTVEIPLSIGGEVDEVILVVSGTTASPPTSSVPGIC